MLFFSALTHFPRSCPLIYFFYSLSYLLPFVSLCLFPSLSSLSSLSLPLCFCFLNCLTLNRPAPSVLAAGGGCIHPAASLAGPQPCSGAIWEGAAQTDGKGFRASGEPKERHLSSCMLPPHPPPVTSRRLALDPTWSMAASRLRRITAQGPSQVWIGLALRPGVGWPGLASC